MATIDTLAIQFSTPNAKKAVETIQGMAQAVRGLAQGLQGIETSKLDSFANAMGVLKSNAPTDNQAKNMKSFAEGVSQLSAAVNGANLTAFATDIANISNGAQGLGARATNKITNLVAGLAQAGQQAQAVANTVQNASNKISANVSNTGSIPSLGSTNDVVASLEKVEVKAKGITGILAKMGIKVPTKQFKSLENEAAKVADKYEILRAKMQEALNSGEVERDSSKYKNWERNLEAIRNEYERLIQKQKELAQEGGFKVDPNFSKAYQGISQAVGGVKQTFSGVGSVVKTVNGYINTFAKKISGLGSATRKAKHDTVSLTDSFKKMANEITRVSKMLKLMITRMALRAVIKEVGNGFKSLALHSQEFDQSMSNLINSSKTLGYSVSGMAGELLNALAPVLLKIIELVNRVINALNQLFSALRGKSTWNKAKDFTGSWSDSIKAANKNAKELKKTVLGFDELNQLQDKKTSGGDTSGNIVDMFEDVPIDPWFKDLAEKIKGWAEKLFAPIKNAWDKVGQWVKEKWKYALDEVLKLGQSVARDFWRVWEQPETEQIFKNLLIIVGEIGRTVGNLAKQFRKAWDENDTGYKILVAIRDIILIITNHLRNMATATADWAATLDFSPLLTSIQKWLESLEPAIDAVMGILEDFYKEVVLKFTKWVIESGLPKLIDVFTRFNDEVDWEGLRSKLAELWKHLEPFMETVGEGLIIFIERVTTALKDFINGEEFAEFLDKLGKWMDTVEPEDVADAIERFVKALVAFKIAAAAISALSGVASIISGIVTAFKGVASIASGVSTFVSAIGGLGSAILPIVAIAAALAVAIYSLVESYGGLKEVIDKVKETINNVVEALKPLVENSGMADEIENLKDAFDRLKAALGGMKSVWDVVFKAIEVTAKWLGAILIPIINALIEMSTDCMNTIAGVVAVISGLFDILVGLFTGDGEKIKQGAEKMWEGIKGAFRGGVEYIWDLLKGFVETLISPFAAAKYALVGDPIVIDMWDDITKVFDDAIEDIVGFVNDLKDDIIKVFNDIKTTVSEKIADIKQKFQEWGEKFDETKKKIVETIDGLKEDFSNFKDKIAETFSKDNWTFSGVVDGLKETFTDAKDAVKGIWNSISDGLSGDYEIGSKKFSVKIPKFTYATGGFPEDGIFFANHNELVGEFSNGKTAVANNAQIVQGIQNGVYNAVVSAMSQQSGNNGYISNEIIIDGEVVARSITKAQEKRNMRYSPQTV